MSFPFDQQFQSHLLRLCVEEDAFAQLAVKNFQPHYFENAAFRWVFLALKGHYERYARSPKFLALYDYARALDPQQGAALFPTIQYLDGLRSVACDPQFIGDRVVEWVRRNMMLDGHEHVKALYNGGKLDEALDFWIRRGDEMRQLGISEIDRGFFAEDFEQRHALRQYEAIRSSSNRFPIGIPGIDSMLNGGLPRGQTGLWIAAHKGGKSMMLAWIVFYTLRALRQPVLVFVLEGGRHLFEERLDAAFADSLSSLVARGELNPSTHQMLVDEYREMRGMCIIRGFTKGNVKWVTTTGDVWDEIEDLRKTRGFKPSVVVVDYADILRGRTDLEDEKDVQDAVYKDQTVMATRNDGFAWWTASQSQRIDKAKTDPNFILLGDHVAGFVGKVRHFDFYGSVNRTLEEAEMGKARVFGEAYRYGAGGVLVPVETDFSRGRFIRNIYAQPVVPQEAFG